MASPARNCELSGRPRFEELLEWLDRGEYARIVQVLNAMPVESDEQFVAWWARYTFVCKVSGRMPSGFTVRSISGFRLDWLKHLEACKNAICFNRPEAVEREVKP